MLRHVRKLSVPIAIAVAVWLLFTADLTSDGRIAVATTAAVFLALQYRRAPVEVLFLAGLVIVTLLGVIPPAVAVAGFASKPVLTIGALLVTAAGLRTTGVLDWLGERLLGGAKTERSALARLSVVAPISMFVLNTPLVAMFAPLVVDWCRRRNISPSRLLIPLSYFCILGGVGTLIGTTTTLVVNAVLAGYAGTSEDTPRAVEQLRELSFFEPIWVGLPCAVVGIIYMLRIAPRLLPNRVELIERLGKERREYLVELLVQPTCPLIGKTVEQAGLRHLPGLFLIEIDRGGELVAPVTPKDLIEVHDRLVFTGLVTTIADLERIPGLVPAADLTYEFRPAERTRRHLTEVVLSNASPLVGRSVRGANFRKRYNAAVVAVHRAGERVTNKIGDIVLESGDTLLLQTRDDFVDTHRNNREFFLVSRVGGSSARRHDRAALAGGLFLLLIAWLAACSLVPAFLPGLSGRTGHFFTTQSHAVAAIAVALAMVLTRCLSVAGARAAIDLQVLLTIAAAIGLGEALAASGAAEAIAREVVTLVERFSTGAAKPYALLAIIYLLAMVCTEMITNVAVASIMIPIAINVAVVGGFDPRPFILAITMAASLSFVTPIGYQTNLMVMGPGGYQPRDFAKVGLPLSLSVAATALILIPVWWPFY